VLMVRGRMATLRQLNKLLEMSAEDLYATGHWITFHGKPMFIGGVKRKRRPKKPDKPVGKVVTITKKDGSTFKKRVYPKSWVNKQSKFKFAVMASLAKNVDRMDRMLTLESGRKKMDQKKATATALKIMLLTGMRVGGGKGRTGMTKGEETYGTTSLERRHVKIEGDKVTFNYKGKSGVDQHHEVVDADLANAVRVFMGGQDETSPEDKTPLFKYKTGRKTTDVLKRQDVAKRLKKFDPDYKPKDLRTLKANTVASDELANMLDEPRPSPTTKAAKKKFIKKTIDRITDKVASVLGNTKSVAKSNYINPHLIEAALAEMGLS